MSKKQIEITELETHIDKRGSLNEILRFKDQEVPGGGQLYTFSINPGERRGDHYHERKHEWFTCVYGKAIILMEDKKGNKKKVVLNSQKPTVVYNAPYTSHAFLNETDEVAILVSYGSSQHNTADPDTIPKVVE